MYVAAILPQDALTAFFTVFFSEAVYLYSLGIVMLTFSEAFEVIPDIPNSASVNVVTNAVAIILFNPFLIKTPFYVPSPVHLVILKTIYQTHYNIYSQLNVEYVINNTVKCHKQSILWFRLPLIKCMVFTYFVI